MMSASTAGCRQLPPRHPQRDNEQYSDEEAQRRFLTAVKAGLNTKPTPLKSIVPKGVPAQSKKQQASKVATAHRRV
jgi:hypothetical protein